MTIEFHKTGRFTNAFLGDTYRAEYVFTRDKLPIARLIYIDSECAIEVDGKTFQIQPVFGTFTIKKHEILEGNSLIGQIRPRWFLRLIIELKNDKSYELKRIYKSFWDRFGNDKNYLVHLQSAEERIVYAFVKGARFEKGYGNQRYCELKGQIEMNSDKLTIALLGIFLIEQLLDQENS